MSGITLQKGKYLLEFVHQETGDNVRVEWKKGQGNYTAEIRDSAVEAEGGGSCSRWKSPRAAAAKDTPMYGMKLIASTKINRSPPHCH